MKTILTLLNTEKEISVNEFKWLVKEIHKHHQEVCIKYRLLGERWTTNFTRMLYATEKGAILNNEKIGKVIFIDDLKTVTHIELDTPIHNFEPRVSYRVTPTSYM